MRNNVVIQYGESRFPGLNICAKSGTAEIDDVDAHNTALFVGFLDDEEHPYAFMLLLPKEEIPALRLQVQLQIQCFRQL